MERVIRAIKQDIEDIVRQAFAAVKLGNSTILKEMKVIASNNGDLVFDIILNDYIEYIEHGRRKGKMPPIEPIENWMKRHGIPISNSVIYAIRKTIGDNGIRPRPVLDTIFSEIDKRWDGEWSDRLFDEIMNKIDNFFK